MTEKKKTKREVDAELDEAIKESFPASDPPAIDEEDKVPVRPVHRKPAAIDKALVDKLARKAKQGGDAD